MRIVVTGVNGQIAASLIERGRGRADIIALGRPRLDLANRESVLRAIEAAPCDVIVNAAAYTAVDKAEQEPGEAMRINADGAAHVAEAAAIAGVPLLQLSTDYVFDGASDRPYRETDPTGPASAYGRSKLAGERRVLVAQPNCAILRTAWVYSPFGANFVRTMLRLGETREEIGVVADQHGNPSYALDIADALLAIAARLAEDASLDLRGVFHMTGQGEATWADVAEAIFAAAERHGRKPARVRRIGTFDYPTLAKRPANSRLDNGKLSRNYGVVLPEWRRSLSDCVDRLLSMT
jgi:dTDP-4-dehydrorhamnose reductase